MALDRNGPRSTLSGQKSSGPVETKLGCSAFLGMASKLNAGSYPSIPRHRLPLAAQIVACSGRLAK
jgi:hypothetical protein